MPSFGAFKSAKKIPSMMEEIRGMREAVPREEAFSLPEYLSIRAPRTGHKFRFNMPGSPPQYDDDYFRQLFNALQSYQRFPNYFRDQSYSPIGVQEFYNQYPNIFGFGRRF